MSPIETLARRQLDAYNRADLDAFCACYHAEVVVLVGDERKLEGIAAFRESYRARFGTAGFGATVGTRLVLGDHCVDDERWWTGDGHTGRVLVRYTRRDDHIGVVQFLREAT